MGEKLRRIGIAGHRRALAVTLALVVAVASLAGWWFATGRGATSSHAGPTPTAAASGSLARDAGNVAEVLRALPAQPAAAVASSSQGFVTDPAAALPAGSAVEPHPETWQPDQVGGGTMTATVMVPGKPPVVYLVVMVRESGNWKVAATIPVSGP